MTTPNEVTREEFDQLAAQVQKLVEMHQSPPPMPKPEGWPQNEDDLNALSGEEAERLLSRQFVLGTERADAWSHPTL